MHITLSPDLHTKHTIPYKKNKNIACDIQTFIELYRLRHYHKRQYHATTQRKAINLNSKNETGHPEIIIKTHSTAEFASSTKSIIKSLN